MRNQRGYTLLETSLAIAVSLTIGAIAIAGMNIVSEGSRERESLSQIQTLVQIAADRAGQGSVPATDLHVPLIAAGSIPEGWLLRNTTPPTLRGAWGGAITIDSIALLPGSAFADGIRVNATGMSRSTCTRLLMSTAPGVWSSAVGGTIFKAENNSLEITQDRASTVCANSQSQTVTFVFQAR